MNAVVTVTMGKAKESSLKKMELPFSLKLEAVCDPPLHPQMEMARGS